MFTAFAELFGGLLSYLILVAAGGKIGDEVRLSQSQNLGHSLIHTVPLFSLLCFPSGVRDHVCRDFWNYGSSLTGRAHPQSRQTRSRGQACVKMHIRRTRTHDAERGAF